MTIQVKKKNKETSESLIRRFSRRVQQSGVLIRARRTQFREEEKSRREKREEALYKLKIRKMIEKAKKMGKFDEDTLSDIKRKLE